MAYYRIVCTEEEPVYLPTTHAHIVAVGTGTDPERADTRWTLMKFSPRWIAATASLPRGTTAGRSPGSRSTRAPAAGEHLFARLRMP